MAEFLLVDRLFPRSVFYAPQAGERNNPGRGKQRAEMAEMRVTHTIAATVSSAFAAIIVGALTLNIRPTLAFGEEHLRMHIVQLCPHADQTPTCTTRLRRPRLESALRGRLIEVP